MGFWLRFVSRQREMALVRARGYVIGEVIKKSIVPFIPNSWGFTILQAIPAPFVYVGFRVLLAFFISVGSRLASYNFYKWVPFLPHSSSNSNVVKVEEIVDSGENTMNVITSLTVSTDQVSLITENLTTTTKNALFDGWQFIIDVVIATGVCIFGTVIVGLVVYNLYKRYYYTSKINKLVNDQNLLIDKYNNEKLLFQDSKRILEREEYLISMRMKGFYWEENGRVLGGVESVKKVDKVGEAR